MMPSLFSLFSPFCCETFVGAVLCGAVVWCWVLVLVRGGGAVR